MKKLDNDFIGKVKLNYTLYQDFDEEFWQDYNPQLDYQWAKLKIYEDYDVIRKNTTLNAFLNRKSHMPDSSMEDYQVMLVNSSGKIRMMYKTVEDFFNEIPDTFMLIDSRDNKNKEDLIEWAKEEVEK